MMRSFYKFGKLRIRDFMRPHLERFKTCLSYRAFLAINPSLSHLKTAAREAHPFCVCLWRGRANVVAGLASRYKAYERDQRRARHIILRLI